MLVDYIKENKRKFRLDSNLKFMDQVLRYHHYAYRTEQTDYNWSEQYINLLNEIVFIKKTFFIRF